MIQDLEEYQKWNMPKFAPPDEFGGGGGWYTAPMPPQLADDWHPPAFANGVTCAVGSRALQLPPEKVSICNTSSVPLIIEIERDSGKPAMVSLGGGQLELFEVGASGHVRAVVPTGEEERSFVLSGGQHYTLEAQNNVWVIAQLR
ncbi:hypothetical protein NKH48_34335 [Mesorhizobium sp. M1233]|uniref:hypothetical protein n=1 Tax=Mesorhizobium sp. M1233 TaxID=2957072 RepID=UPI00333C52B3